MHSKSLARKLGVNASRESNVITLLTETFTLCNPQNLSDGYMVETEIGKRGRMIFSLPEFVIGEVCFSEKGTKLIRLSNDELLLGGM